MSATDDGDELGERTFREGDVGGRSGQRDGVAPHVDVRRQEGFEGDQILVRGSEQGRCGLRGEVEARFDRGRFEFGGLVGSVWFTHVDGTSCFRFGSCTTVVVFVPV